MVESDRRAQEVAGGFGKVGSLTEEEREGGSSRQVGLGVYIDPFNATIQCAIR